MLSLEIAERAFVVHQPIVAKLRLHARAAMTIPFAYDDTDVVTFELLDEQGGLLASADGYAVSSRLGLTGDVTPQAKLETTVLGAGATIEWQQDLLRYFDISAPGRYGVRARWSFEPSSSLFESEVVAFVVVEQNGISFDFHQGGVTMKMAYLLEQHRIGGRAALLFHVLNGFTTTFWKSAAFDVASAPDGGSPRLSDAAFSTRATHEHDFFRWVAWSEAARVVWIGFQGDQPTGEQRELRLAPTQRWLGRPLQHEDQSLSLLVVDAGNDGRSHLSSRHVSREGELLESHDLGWYRGTLEPIANGADWSGRHTIVFGESSGLPLHRVCVAPDGRVSHTVIQLDTAGDEDAPTPPLWRILGLRATAKRDLPTLRAAYLTAIDTTIDDGRRVLLARIPLEPAPDEQPVTRVLVLPNGCLRHGERVVGADFSDPRSGATDPLAWHVAIGTSGGRVLYAPRDGEPRLVAETSPDRTTHLRMATLANGDIVLFYLTPSQGVATIRLAKRL